MNFNNRLGLPVLLLLSFFYACKKSDLPAVGGNRLQKVVSGKDSLFYTIYDYDSLKRLIYIIDSNNNGHATKTFIDYNASGKPTKFKALRTYYGKPDGWGSESSDSLLYNVQGQVVQQLYTSAYYGPNNLSHTYSYDAQGRLAADSFHSYSTREVTGYVSFTYDNSDNVVLWQLFYKEAGLWKINRTIKIFYDKQPNPYATVGFNLYFIRDEYYEDYLPGRNNPVRIEYSDGLIKSYAYQYYNNGLPKNATLVNEHRGIRYPYNMVFSYH